MLLFGYMTEPKFRWNVFGIGLLRSAGFPFEWLDNLASETFDNSGKVLVEARRQRELARDGTLRALWAMRGSVRPDKMPSLNRAIRRVDRYKQVAEPDPVASEVIVNWNEQIAMLTSRYENLHSKISASLAAEYEREVGLLLGHAASAYFKDAVLLSSPSAYDEFCRTSDRKSFRPGRELVAYRFLQRFCAKNEMGGPVGPVNLISFGAREADEPGADPGGPLGPVNYAADGDGRSARRRTLLSYWAACEIGRTLTQSADDPHRVRRPYRVYQALPADLPDRDEHLLSRIDGLKTISELTAEAGLSPDAADAALARLAGLGLVGDDWAPPYFATDPGEDVRELADLVGTPEAGKAKQLTADVENFAQIPFEERPAALSNITRDFTELTKKPAWRGSGQFYADRSVLHEEATGNIRAARIGSAEIQVLAERLSTILDFIASLAVEERAAGQSLLAGELARRGVAELAASEVREMPTTTPEASGAQETLRARFLRLLDPTAACAELSRRDLARAGLIRGDLSDWPIFGSADLMLTGRPGSSEPGSIVLSELHHIWPTLACQVRALYDDVELGNRELWDIVAGELAPAMPTVQEIVRKEKTSDSSACGHVVLCLETGRPVPGALTVPTDRAVVRRWRNGFIGLHDPVSQRDLWLLPEYDTTGVAVGGLMNCAIPALALRAFTLGAYTPRIIVDGIVVQRRRWEVPAADVPQANGRLPTGDEWLAVQAWRHHLGIPKCAYFRINTERKPVYLDFSSVVSVANFLRLKRQAQQVVLTEALPDSKNLWLRTKDGSLTSEIRTLLWRNR
jgi:hypothetical protein